MRASKNIVNQLKCFEGDSRCNPILTPYKDTSKGYSIGYGRFFPKGKNMPTKITKSQALKMLKEDIENVEKLIKGNLKKEITQNQFDALVSFGYNYPNGMLKAIGKINKSDYNGLKNVFYESVFADKKPIKALVNRRLFEWKLFNTSDTLKSRLKEGFSNPIAIILMAIILFMLVYSFLKTSKNLRFGI